MRNPYEVLGIPRGSGMDRVKAAYRELARKYRDEGKQKKTEELDAAYDAIVLSLSSGASGETESGRGRRASRSDYSDIRKKIDSGRLEDARILLDGVPENARDAQWYYLKGTVWQKKGWLEEAAKNFATACEMDPYDEEYGKAYDKINEARSGGYRTERRRASGRVSTGRSVCDICASLLCADFCCECFGGDLIPCC